MCEEDANLQKNKTRKANQIGYNTIQQVYIILQYFYTI